MSEEDPIRPRDEGFKILAWGSAAGHPLDTWHTRQAASDSGDLTGVCHGQGLFVAVGRNGVILTSSTGETWNVQSSGTTAWLLAVTWGEGLFEAVGEAGMVLSSEDGMNWTTQASGVITDLYAVRFTTWQCARRPGTRNRSWTTLRGDCAGGNRQPRLGAIGCGLWPR